MKNWNIIHFDTLGSTNVELAGMSKGYTDKTVIVADTQTAGRGRNGKSWISPSGGLYASILFKPAPPAVISSGVSLLLADIIRGILSRNDIEAEIKWPNDVLVDGRKIAGILSEFASEPKPRLITGFGINLDISPQFSDNGFPSASWTEFDKPPVPSRLLDDILSEIDIRWGDRNSNPLDSLVEIEKHLWKFGENVTLLLGDKIVEGVFAGITEDGYLRLQIKGKEITVNSGSILSG